MDNKETNKNEKAVTKYDLKMQKREEEKKKAKKQKKISLIGNISLLTVLVILIVSFPIRAAIANNAAYIEINGEKISRVVYDYNYNSVYNGYINVYSSYLSMFGLDLSKDLSKQQYTDTLTWQDFFDNLAVENLINRMAIKDDAEKNGFEYDTEADYKKFVENIENAAKAAGVSVNAYVKDTYGKYAKLSRLEKFIKDSLYADAYYSVVAERVAPTDEDIKAYYEEYKADYDSVDYRYSYVAATMPVAPTELAGASPVFTTDSTTGTSVYQPNEAEIARAMENAKAEADKALGKIGTADLIENLTKTSVPSPIRDWMFDETRKKGDKTIIEDTASNAYYIVQFEDRYLDDTPTCDVKIIMTTSFDGQKLLEQWKLGGGTEALFDSYFATYDESGTGSDLYQGISKSGVDKKLADWLFDPARKEGDVVDIEYEGEGDEEPVSYFMYYKNTNEAEWKSLIENTLLTDNLAEYKDSICVEYKVTDTHGHINMIE